MPDLFSDAAAARLPATAPLALRMRPQTLETFVGQTHVLSEGSALRLAIEEDRVASMILYGPPGSGKTTLARIVAVTTGAAFEELSAVSATVAQVREVIAGARERLGALGTRTILFLDEIHRFNKAQQDALLPAVEEGLVTLIGATTENPYFEVNAALLSRCQIYELRPLLATDIVVLLRRAVEAIDAAVDDDAIEFLAARAGGDARTALAALELAAATHDVVTLEAAEDALQRRALTYDKTGDRHYDTISAWIKATRGSDPDASLYYLAVMLEGGEDARFIARRMVILAAVADEEHSSLGVQEALGAVSADAAIVTEPTELELIVAHKGFVWAEIEVQGVAAHGSRPHLGVDAIVKTGPVLTALRRLDRDLAARTHPLLGRGSVHASIIRGGEELSSYPARCVLGLERRTLPGETAADIEAELGSLLNACRAADAELEAGERTMLVRGPVGINDEG